jgi:hypothetical protein
MSKAKAILQRIVDGDNRGDFFISNELLKEIEVALAQPEQTEQEPEQTEQEPVAWMYEPEPLSDERLEFLVDKYHNYPKTLGRAIEKAHGIGGGE